MTPAVAWEAIQAAGATSLRAIAAGLNYQGIPTARGAGTWGQARVGAYGMTDEVRKLVSDRLDEIGMTMKEASTKIGRNESFVHQFLKRGHPAELRERDREKLAQVLGIRLMIYVGLPIPCRYALTAVIRNLYCLPRAARPTLRNCATAAGSMSGHYEIVAEEQNSSASAENAKAALRLFR